VCAREDGDAFRFLACGFVFDFDFGVKLRIDLRSNTEDDLDAVTVAVVGEAAHVFSDFITGSDRVCMALAGDARSVALNEVRC